MDIIIETVAIMFFLMMKKYYILLSHLLLYRAVLVCRLFTLHTDLKNDNLISKFFLVFRQLF